MSTHSASPEIGCTKLGALRAKQGEQVATQEVWEIWGRCISKITRWIICTLQDLLLMC